MGDGEERVTSSPLRCLFLDMGKVLFYFDFRSFGDRMRLLAGVETEELRTAIVDGNLAFRFETGQLGGPEFHREICRRIGHDVPWDDFVAAWNSIFSDVPIIPEDLVCSLASRVNLWIVSNTNKIHSDFILTRYPILRYFKGWVLSHEVGVLKPDPRIFAAALERAGIEAYEALFVDDQSANVDAARSLGLDAFQFFNVRQFTEELMLRGLL